ncbi:hypothetical protein [Caldifermentibacillus hisashii]
MFVIKRVHYKPDQK